MVGSPDERKVLEYDRALAAAGHPALMDQRRVAQLFGCTERTIRQYEAAGKLRAVRDVGVRVIYPRLEVARFLVERMRG
jgi:predicted transcriptional regulator